MLTSRIINVKDFDNFLKSVYGDKNMYILNEQNGQSVLRNFTYSSVDATDPYFNNSSVKFFILYDESKHNIVGIIKFATTFVGASELVKDEAGVIYYLEINKKYRGQHLLHVLTDQFAKYYPQHALVSNSESRDGSITHVNAHLRKSFEDQGLYFYDSDSKYFKENYGE